MGNRTEFIGLNLYYSQEFVDDLQNDYIEEMERLNNIIEDFEIELQREINIRKEDTNLEENTFFTINNTLKNVLKRFRELKGSDKE